MLLNFHSWIFITISSFIGMTDFIFAILLPPIIVKNNLQNWLKKTRVYLAQNLRELHIPRSNGNRRMWPVVSLPPQSGIKKKWILMLNSLSPWISSRNKAHGIVLPTFMVSYFSLVNSLKMPSQRCPWVFLLDDSRSDEVYNYINHYWK